MEEIMSVHGKPYEDMECLATMEEITEEEGNYCEYQTFPSLKWHPSLFASDVIQTLLETQFHTFMKKVQQPDCKAEFRRLLVKGPPVYIEDKHALPLPESDDYICKLWFAKTQQEVSAKLDGAIEGKERQEVWDKLKTIMEAMEDDS